MANPYPPNQGMPGMQPMQQQMQPQMHPPQMQQPPRGPNVTKSGTSRAVPVVVSAGLAVGVFCGLLFGVGIPEDANAGPSTGNNVKAADPAETTPTPTASASTATKPTTTAPATKPATATAPAAGTTAGSATASTGATPAPAAGTTTGSAATTGTKPAAGAGSAAPTVAATPALKKVKFIVEVKPDTVAATAKITVDAKDITGGTTELEIPGDGKKEVKVVVKASGYKTVEQKVEVEGDVTVKVELIKRSGGGGGGGGTPARPPTGGGKKKQPGGGLIDI